MKYKILGHSGLRVSELCLGTMTFGEETGIGAPEAECRAIFDRFLAAGGNFIDTANIYTHGTSERMLRGFIAAEREALVVASKFTFTTRADDPNAGGNHRKNLVQALDASLRRLGTAYLDLFWVHAWDGTTDACELMRALDDQVRAGKVLHVGISNAPAWVISSANTLARERGLTPFTAMQLHYNVVERSIEQDFFDLAQAQSMAITAWSPLAGGLLTGKFAASAPADARSGARLATTPMGARVLLEQNMAAAEALSAMARGLGCTPAQLALAWMMQRSDAVLVPIIGARNRAQLEDNLGSLDLRLDPAQIAQVDALMPPATGYPRSLLQNPFFRRMLRGPVSGSA